MTPNIPLSPTQRRKRRNNILFSICFGSILLAVLTYYVYPLLTQAKAHTPPAAEQLPPQADSESYTIERDELDYDDFAREKEETEAEDTTLSEEELAKLPPWQAAFERLSLSDRRAFATAFTKAKAAYSAEQWTACLAYLNDCELVFSHSPNACNLRACALLESGGYDEAEACINRSLELAPQNMVALMCLSELHMLRRDFRNSIPPLEQLRQAHLSDSDRSLRDTFTFHQLLCHLMLRQEMEARALVADLTPLTDSPLYYFSQAAFLVYKGDSNGALEPLRSATTIYGEKGATTSYRKWMEKCGLADKYVRNRQED